MHGLSSEMFRCAQHDKVFLCNPGKVIVMLNEVKHLDDKQCELSEMFRCAQHDNDYSMHLAEVSL